MPQNWSEKWKQTKSDLVRSMFEDISMLSPIAETNEPVPDILSADGEESSTSNRVMHRELASNDSENINNNLITEQSVINSTISERSPILVPRKELDILSKKMGEQPILTDSVGLVGTQVKTDNDVLMNLEEETEKEQIENVRLGATEIRTIGSITGEQISKESLTPTTVVERDMFLIQNVGTSPETHSRSDSSEDPYGLVEMSRDSNYSRKRAGPSVCFNKKSPIKRKRYETKAVQTSSNCNEEMIWEGVRDNFFCGTPLIYKLCRCRDHECV